MAKSHKPDNSRPSSRLFRHSEATWGVAGFRVRFLAAAMGIPESARLLMELFAPEFCALARRDFRYRPNAEPSLELERRIESWAVRCRLGDPPIRNWWIYSTAKNKLSDTVWNRQTDDEPEDAGWMVPATLHSQEALASPQKVHHEFDPWDPTLETVKEYLNAQRDAFEACLRLHISSTEERYQQVGYRRLQNPRDNKPFEWLVRYQLLKHSYQEIARTPGQHTTPDNVQTTISPLRRAILLPPVRPSGRPRKS
jgi:hypothetical protein